MQGTGRLLVGTDINQSLPGRHAELYWPPEQLWYLVEIQSVDVGERNAIIMYYSGGYLCGGSGGDITVSHNSAVRSAIIMYYLGGGRGQF